MHIDGTFAIQMTAEPPYHDAEGVTLGRFRFTRQFSGPLTATSTVEMLGARTAIDADSATGALRGLRGAMTIRVETGVHHYGFDYTIADV
jgi:hypothetical protein